MVNQSTPKFSIVVPLYNCERYIEDCLNSLVNQTESSFEALIVDDCSSDNGYKIAQDRFSIDSRFSFYQNQVNVGLSATRNFAMDKARGEILVFLDADDLLSPDALAKIGARFDVQQLDDLYFNGESFYEDKKSYTLVAEDFSHRPTFDGVASGKEVFVHFEKVHEFFPQAAMHAYRRSFVEQNNMRFKEGILHEDVLFTFQVIVASKRCSFLNEPIYQRRIHLGSIMAQPKRTMKNIEGHLVGVHYIEQWLNENYANKPKELITALDNNFMQAALQLCNEYRWLCAKDYYSDISEDEKEQYLASLNPKTRMAFENEVGQLSEVYKRFYESRVHQAGIKVTALPKAIRDIARASKHKNPKA